MKKISGGTQVHCLPYGHEPPNPMLTIFDSESPLSEQERLEVRDYAKGRIGLWRRRSIYSAVALVASCTSVIPFSRALSSRSCRAVRETVGLALYGAAYRLRICTGFFYSAWQALRDMEKGQE